MEALNGKNLTEEAYEKIKGFILRSEIYPRQKIIIEDLAKQMGISRTPIREAMSRLVKDGYVKQIWNRGFFVNEITVEEVEALYGARRVSDVCWIWISMRRSPRLPAMPTSSGLWRKCSNELC